MFNYTFKYESISLETEVEVYLECEVEKDTCTTELGDQDVYRVKSFTVLDLVGATGESLVGKVLSNELYPRIGKEFDNIISYSRGFA